MVAPDTPLVSILIVTYNSERHLAACFESLRRQDWPVLEVIIIDNGSSDGTQGMLEKIAPGWKVVLNHNNRGFAAAQNQAIRQAKSDWLLTLNPDVALSPDFVSQLMSWRDKDERIGLLCGKLLRLSSGGERTSVIDSTGIYFTTNLRHLDRGADEVDRGQYQRVQYVFGATGAAALFRRKMIEDVSVNGELFDEDFFSYREDADLAWRAQILGWKCLYVPSAVAWHERRVTPERRGQLPHQINWHSVKNRFIMRAKNASFWLGLRFFIPIAARDFLIFGYALLRDWKLFSALAWPPMHVGQIHRKRKWIQSHRRVSDRELARWFSNTPHAENFQE
jgi:GT2 family glycosyltransferase